MVFIPVLDFLLAVIRRTKEGRHPFSADKQHLHHRMLNIGHTHRQAVLIFYLWALVLTGTAVSLAFLSWQVAVIPAVIGVAVALDVLALAADPGPAADPAPGRGDGMTRDPKLTPDGQVDLSVVRAGRPPVAQRAASGRSGHLPICWSALVAGGLVLGLVGLFVGGHRALVGVLIGTLIVGLFFTSRRWSSPG